MREDVARGDAQDFAALKPAHALTARLEGVERVNLMQYLGEHGFTGTHVGQVAFFPDPQKKLGVAADNVGKEVALTEHGDEQPCEVQGGRHKIEHRIRRERCFEVALKPHEGQRGIGAFFECSREMLVEPGAVFDEQFLKHLAGPWRIGEFNVVEYRSHDGLRAWTQVRITDSAVAASRSSTWVIANSSDMGPVQMQKAASMPHA